MLPSSRRVLPIVFALAAISGNDLNSQSTSVARVEAVRFWSFGDVTRIAIQTQGTYKLFSDQIEKPPRVYFDLNGLRPPTTAHRGIQTFSVGDHRVRQIRVAEVSPGKTRIVFDLEAPAEVVSSQLVNPDRLMIEIRPKGTTPAAISVARSVTGSQKVDVSTNSPSEDPSPDHDTPVSTDNSSAPITAVPAVAHDVERSDSTRAVIPPHEATSVSTADPVAHKASASDTAAVTEVQGHDPLPVNAPPRSIPGLASPAGRDSTGDRSLVRVFGLKIGRVVIDPGHGGHDTGTIGPNGLMEKELVLDVALRLGALISQQLGAQVIYTRSDDTFIPLENRTKIANDQKADLFISIHANSSPESTATGVETYYFNLTSDKAGLDLATRENATSNSSISDLNDLLHRAVLQTKMEESREFAQKVQTSLWSTSVRMNPRSRDRGVRRAPFVVLIGATMPSILAEIAFVSNPHDARLLNKGEQRQKIALALFKGISQYANTLSHVQLARAGT